MPTSTSPFSRCRPGQASGSTVAMVTSSGAPSGALPLANRTVAVAAGTISRIATQSVSPGRPSKGRATKGAGAGRVVRSARAPRGRREALPMRATLVAARVGSRQRGRERPEGDHVVGAAEVERGEEDGRDAGVGEPGQTLTVGLWRARVMPLGEGRRGGAATVALDSRPRGVAVGADDGQVEDGGESGVAVAPGGLDEVEVAGDLREARGVGGHVAAVG